MICIDRGILGVPRPRLLRLNDLLRLLLDARTGEGLNERPYRFFAIGGELFRLRRNEGCSCRDL